MRNKVFNKLAKQETDRMLDVMCSKSSDYAKDDDKLFNFKQAGRMDNISPIEALRGMWLKHRASIQQGLDELLAGKKPRPRSWWIEKLTDDRNYNLLLFAQLEEEYFLKDGTSPGYGSKEDDMVFRIFNSLIGTMADFTNFPLNTMPTIKAGTLTKYCSCGCGRAKPVEDDKPEEFMEFTIKKCGLDNKRGFYIIKTDTMRDHNPPQFLRKNFELYVGTGYIGDKHGYGEAPGYYKTKAEARATIVAYKNKPVLHVRYVSLGWYIVVDGNSDLYLCDDLMIHDGTGATARRNGRQEAYGYYLTKGIAEAYVKAYEEKQRCGQG